MSAPERPGRGDRDRIDESAVHEPAPAEEHGVEDAGQGVGCPHGLNERTLVSQISWPVSSSVAIVQ